MVVMEVEVVKVIEDMVSHRLLGIGEIGFV